MGKTKRSDRWIKQTNILSEEKYAGVHLLGEFWQGRIIEDKSKIEKILLKAAEEAGSTVLKISSHKFQPQGLTGFVLLAESHIAIHTWPECGYIAVDIFTCGDRAMPQKAFEYLKKIFKPKTFELRKIKRGKMK